jgi:small subunit ribosomal protein S17e
MGRIRGKFIKNMSKRLVEQYPDKFSKNFEENKKALDVLKLVDDKPIRNKIAGYIVSVVERKKIK